MVSVRRASNILRCRRRIREALTDAASGRKGAAVLIAALRRVARAIGATALRIELAPGGTPASRNTSAARRPPGSHAVERGRPLAVAGHHLGVLYARYSAGRPTAEDMSLLRVAAHELAATVDSATLRAVDPGPPPPVEEVVAILAHELRTPLAAIASTVEILARANRDPRLARAGREIIDRQARYLTRLLDTLLDLGSIAHGTIHLEQSPLDLSSVVAAAIEITLPSIRSKDQTLTVSLPDAGLPIIGDALRLQQVMVNLLANGTKYTPRGGHISVTAGRAGREAAVCIKDSGDGIPHDMLRRVFEPFVRLRQRLRASPPAGLGIGLALVKRLVEAHGGTVEARSAGRHRGSAFVVRLPIAAAGAGRAPANDRTRKGGEDARTTSTLRSLPREHRTWSSPAHAGRRPPGACDVSRSNVPCLYSHHLAPDAHSERRR